MMSFKDRIMSFGRGVELENYIKKGTEYVWEKQWKNLSGKKEIWIHTIYRHSQKVIRKIQKSISCTETVDKRKWMNRRKWDHKKTWETIRFIEI